MNQVMLRRDDFKVCLMALIECQEAWKEMIEEDDLPSGFTQQSARDLHSVYVDVAEKIKSIVNMEPNSLASEEYEQIKSIVEKQ